ncbi:MAG: cytidine deaminase [Bacteroidetes bacterium]|nr:cytidine deaminase [Bacteroidota bacterium]
MLAVEDQLSLVEIARAVLEHACAPYSNFRVGAALLTDEGRVYTGVNVESASYGGTICAERTALVKALSEGERQFVAIAVTSSGDTPVMPCGICRQLLFEYAPGLQVICEGGASVVATHIADLFPHPFT